MVVVGVGGGWGGVKGRDCTVIKRRARCDSGGECLIHGPGEKKRGLNINVCKKSFLRDLVVRAGRGHGEVDCQELEGSCAGVTSSGVSHCLLLQPWRAAAALNLQ